MFLTDSTVEQVLAAENNVGTGNVFVFLLSVLCASYSSKSPEVLQ
jgi:hypothetical protein